MIMTQLVHRDLSLPVRRIHLLVVFAALLENPTFAELPSAISSSIDVDNFRLFAGDLNGASPGIADATITGVSPIAAEFGLVRSLRQIEAHDPTFLITW
jgi:hypothetical protein